MEVLHNVSDNVTKIMSKNNLNIPANNTNLQGSKSPKDLKNLQFQYNKIQGKKKLNKGITLSEHTMNQLLKKTGDVSILRNKIKGYDSNNSNTVESVNNGSNLSKNSKIAVRFNKNVRKGGRTRLKKYQTFQASERRSPKNSSDPNAFLNRMSNITNLNIHININQVGPNEPSPNSKPLNDANDGNKKYSKRKSEQMWNLCKKTIKMAKGFTHHDVTKIDLASDLAQNIADYKKQKEKQIPKLNPIDIPLFNNFMQKSEFDKELIRVHLKESALKVISEGSKNFKRDLDEIFNKNHERYILDSRDPNFLFNQPMPDTKKTLLYTACQEGNYPIVKYFLGRNLNPSIKSKTDANDYESCLEVAARWNYVDIVKILLEKGHLHEVEIREALKNKHIKKPVKDIINDHINKKAQSGKKKGCSCF